MSADPINIAGAAHTRILRALMTWPARDLQILAAAVELGAPSALAAGFPDVPAERDTDPGDVPAVRRLGGADERARADMLHAYRTIAEPLRLMPPPGR